MTTYRTGRMAATIAIAGFLIVGVAACGSSSSSTSSSSAGTSSSSGSTKAPIKIGVDVSLTGPFAPLGISTKDGIVLAANRINAQGGIDGRKIALTILDDGTNPATAISNTNRLISDGADAIIGYNGGQTQVPAAGVVVRNHILTVALSGFNPGQPTGPAYFFASPTLTTHVDAIACYITKATKAKKVGIIATNDAGATLVNTTVTSVLQHDGLSVVSQTVPGGATDVTVAASKLRDANPDLIFDDAVGATGGLAAKTIRALGVKAPIVGWLAWEQAPVLKLYASSLNGIVMEGFISPQHPLPNQTTFVQGWQQAYPSVPPDSYGAWGYDSVNAVADAFKGMPTATQSDGVALGKALESINYRGVVGGWRLGPYDAKNPETHTGMQLADVVWYTIQNGELQPLSSQPKCS